MSLTRPTRRAAKNVQRLAKSLGRWLDADTATRLLERELATVDAAVAALLVDFFAAVEMRPTHVSPTLICEEHLGQRLSAELDAYLQRGPLAIDDLLAIEAAAVDARLQVARSARPLGQRLIATIVEAQRPLLAAWHGVPRVVESYYCVTLDRLPESLWPTIVAGEAQRRAWIELSLLDAEQRVTPELLRSRPHLPLDTRHFDERFHRQVADVVRRRPLDGLLVHGENARALRFLRERFAGQAGCVFIDPPYNTGEAVWSYGDRLAREHWAVMIRERLELARPWMSEQAAIFVSLDDHEQATLRQIMDDVFGPENFVATIVWQKVHTRKNSARHFSVSHDYLVTYARDKSRWRRNLLEREDTSAYANPDDDPRGPWKLDPVYANKPYAADYVIRKPDGLVLSPPAGRYWRFSESNFLDKVERGEVVWGAGQAYPLVKRYLADTQPGLVPETWWTREFAGDNALANRELVALFGSARKVTYPKPSRLVERVLQIATSSSESELVLDFFAGSGTTAAAVLAQNRRDGGNRRYALVELGECFETVLKPRLLKLMYSDRWQGGKPLTANGVSHTLEYVRLGDIEGGKRRAESGA